MISGLKLSHYHFYQQKNQQNQKNSFENYEWMMYDMVREELEKREIGDLSKSDIEHILVEVFSHSVAEWVKEAQKFNMYSLSEYVTLLYNKLLEKWKQKNQ